MRRTVFKRGEGRKPWAKDERGTVRVSVCLKSQGEGGNARGNITRYLTVLDAKVSTVYEAIEHALFIPEGTEP
jgi:hypothetical protein